jgi:cation diffusion facilitator CzcD-associated flavoprotein CzcO
MIEKDVIIIGGGQSGLAIAYFLKRPSPEIMERPPFLGEYADLHWQQNIFLVKVRSIRLKNQEMDRGVHRFT